ncbi:MAG: hypothetical protein M1839_000038 [Geoglossum umbratile]|nr:MAG: hypothetical protein M1839_000038 [Geoglossum umbratile]
MSYQYYMTDAIQQYYYDQIKKTDSIENDVDNFWLNLLPDYFQKKLNFGIEQEARWLPEITGQRADWTIRYVKNGSLKKVVLMEDKRKGMETQSAEWREALSQLTRYLKLVRAEKNQDAKQTLYGVVNMGTYTRFYQLEHHEPECIDYPGTKGKPYELAKDEAEIHEILLDLVQKTSH